MARIVVSSDDGRLTHSERVIPSDLDSQHFRRCLIERVRWAVSDAQPEGENAVIVARSRSRYGDRHSSGVRVAAVRKATRKLAGAGESHRLVAAS